MHPISITAAELQRMHEVLQSSYNDFIYGAPSSWRADGWLESVQPLVFVCAYGQNQALHTKGAEMIAARQHFAKERRWDAMWLISFAIASHVR
jgi:hypothetical protein